MRILVAHVDHRGADLDPFRARTDRREQRKWRAELPREVMNAHVGAVGAELLCGHGELDRLQQRIARRAHLRSVRVVPVSEGEKPDFFHPALDPCSVASGNQELHYGRAETPYGGW